MAVATVTLWGTTIGYVSMDTGERFARFEYDPDFVRMGIELAPISMPLKPKHIYQFPDLDPECFHGLPGLLSNSLPDAYGQRLINIWLSMTDQKPEEFNAVDRLLTIGKRGMGALEFEPAGDMGADKALDIRELADLASLAYADKETLNRRLGEEGIDQAFLDILRVGTSAGGARAKAVIACNPNTGDVRSGLCGQMEGFEDWLIKFDGVEYNGDRGTVDPAGYGLLEYSYYKTAKNCGIDMMDSKLLQIDGHNHFMTRRFDRDQSGRKLFTQTLSALAHFDYNLSGHYSYEQVFQIMKRLKMPMPQLEEQFRRVIFNLVGCNQDDHVKNISFLMDRQGSWSLSPAYDMCHAEGPSFTRFHQLSVNGKRSDFDRSDIKALAEFVGLPKGRYKHILEETIEAFALWKHRASELDIPKALQDHVFRTLRLKW